MSGVFQPNVFQHNVFQQTGEAPVVSTSGAGAGKKKRRRILVKIDEDYFEVNTDQEAIALLTKARAAAEETAKAVAAEAVQKAARTRKPVAKSKALEVRAPKLSVVDPGPGFIDDFIHRLRAQVDAAQAEISQTYAKAMLAEHERIAKMAEQDEKDVEQILVLDAQEEEQLVSEFLKTFKTRSKK